MNVCVCVCGKRRAKSRAFEDILSAGETIRPLRDKDTLADSLSPATKPNRKTEAGISIHIPISIHHACFKSLLIVFL